MVVCNGDMSKLDHVLKRLHSNGAPKVWSPGGMSPSYLSLHSHSPHVLQTHWLTTLHQIIYLSVEQLDGVTSIVSLH